MTPKNLTGGCLCGSVRYSISEKPQRGYICHCRFCQKQTGMGARPAIAVNKASIEMHGDSIGQYKHVVTDHGRAIFPMFCSKCGTNLGSTLEMFSDEALSCVAHKSSHTVYPKHRLNEDGSAAIPKVVD